MIQHVIYIVSFVVVEYFKYFVGLDAGKGGRYDFPLDRKKRGGRYATVYNVYALEDAAWADARF